MQAPHSDNAAHTGPHIEPSTAPQSAPIRRPLFFGTQQVSALWFDPALINERDIQQRILAHWHIGAKLYRIAQGYLLYFATPRLANCAMLDGLALCDQTGVLSSAPLTPLERKQAHVGSVWLVLGAQALVVEPQETHRINPAIWLDVRHIPLRTPLTPPRATHAEMILTADPLREVRDVVGGKVGAASQESLDFLQALQHAEQGKLAAQNFKQKLLQAGAGMLSGLLGKFFEFIAASSSGHSIDGDHHTAASEHRPQTAQASKFGLFLHQLAAKLANLSKISALLGMQHARYVKKLLDMFDQGDILEALRHAIPLSDGNESGDTKQLLSTLSPRDSLTIGKFGHSQSTVGVGEALMEYLRKKYRQVFERLAREGKIDEAVFVLAELLKAGKEAVDFLERHQRLKQAAELAQTLALAPEIAIRLWLLAGERERAVRLARVHNAFEATLRMLGNAHAALTRELRLIWAQEQAARGEWIGTVLTLWPLLDESDDNAALKKQVQQCLAFAQQAGGQLGVQALVCKLALFPEALPACKEEIVEILHAEGNDAAQQRARLGQALISANPASSAHKRLMQQLLRHLIPERLAGHNALPQLFFQQAVQLADSALLRADTPKLTLPDKTDKPLQLVSSPLTFEMEERGTWTIHDACRLTDGYLLALGESGVVRINQFGKQIAHFPTPAHHLVLASSEQRALALAKRENVLRISQLDLTRRSVADWLSLPCSFWANDYDGALWNVVMHNKLLAIDTSKAQLTVAWQVADLPGKIINFHQNSKQQSLLLQNARELQKWCYALPERRLLARDTCPFPETKVWRLHYEAGDMLCQLEWLQDQQMENSHLRWNAHLGGNLQLSLGNLKSAPHIAINSQFLAVLAHTGDAAHVQIAQINTGRLLANCRFLHAQQANLRWQGKHLLAFDQAGHLFDMDVASSEVRSMSLQ